jgi:hypothetical protein
MENEELLKLKKTVYMLKDVRRIEFYGGMGRVSIFKTEYSIDDIIDALVAISTNFLKGKIREMEGEDVGDMSIDFWYELKYSR